MNREVHVRFWEGLRVRFPRATHFGTLQTGGSFSIAILDESRASGSAGALPRCDCVGDGACVARLAALWAANTRRVDLCRRA